MLKKILKKIPKTPGVYKFFNKNGDIIYIGKSINLYSRVNSYFNGKSNLNFAKKRMVKLITDITTIITDNEKESLILESTLIKKHLPKYNILMKDGKNHLYIKITDGEFPKIIKTRIKNNSGTYFGPYISGFYVENILKSIKKIFGYGVAEHNFFKNSKSYNLDKYLFEGDLKNDENKKSCISDLYRGKINDIKLFLKGDFKEIIKKMHEEMISKSKELKFEEAGKIKILIDSIKSLEETQNVRDTISGDYDVVNYVEKYDNIFIGHIEIRDSKITGLDNYSIENKLIEDKEEVLINFIEKYIFVPNLEHSTKKQNIIVPMKLEFSKELAEYIRLDVPKIGNKNDILKLCYKNVYDYAHKKYIDSLSTKSFTKKTMISLLDLLGYKQKNKHIIFECIDISHFSGTHTVASRSVVQDGKTDSSKYRKFRIKNLSELKIDDFKSMKDIMSRRLLEIEKTGFVPDLTLIDGGKGQLSSVIEIKDNFKSENEETMKEISKMQIVSIAKKEEELFIPGEQDPIIIDKNSPELRLLQKLRDEAHRFAISFNRDSRIKSMKKNILESIPGFGPKTRKKLLKKYGSIDNIASVSKEELLTLISKNQLEQLENHGIF